MNESYYHNEALFSAGGVLVHPVSKQVFLIYKNKTGEWLLPKGRIEKGETVEKAAEREVYEETGYKNSVTELLSVQTRQDINDPRKSKVIFWFCCVVKDEKKVEGTQADGEDFSGKWFSEDEALSVLAWDNDKKLVQLSLSCSK